MENTPTLTNWNEVSKEEALIEEAKIADWLDSYTNSEFMKNSQWNIWNDIAKNIWREVEFNSNEIVRKFLINYFNLSESTTIETAYDHLIKSNLILNVETSKDAVWVYWIELALCTKIKISNYKVTHNPLIEFNIEDKKL